MTGEQLLKSFWRVGIGIPASVLIAQPARASVMQVTDAQLNPTDNIVEVEQDTRERGTGDDIKLQSKIAVSTGDKRDKEVVLLNATQDEEAKQPLTLVPNFQFPIAKISRLSELDRPATTLEEWHSQLPTPESQSPTQITGVRLNPTADGIEVILETADGTSPQVSTSSSDQTLLIDVSNAKLNLPAGEEFRADNPAEGITSVTVTPLSTNSVRVTVIGKTAVPTARAVPGQQGLVLSITPAQSTAQEPSTPTPEPPSEKPDVEKKPAPTAEEPEIEVVVTAEKREENVQDVPLSITTLTEQQLENAQINSIEGISRNAPNVFNLPSSPGNFSFYSIRGLGNSNFLSRDAVGFYIDDIPYDTGGFFVDTLLTDLERVEVLRGPQNTLYGRSSSAGVVNIITRPPSNQPEIRAAASYGNYDNLNLQLSLSDAIIPDKLRFRLAGAYTNREGFVENVFLNRTVGDRREGTGIGQLLWTPSPDWTISFTSTFNSSDNDGFANQFEPFKSNQELVGFVRLDSNTQALKISYDNPGFRVNSITTRRFSDFSRQVDDGTPIELFRNPLTTETTTWTQEVRLQSPQKAERFRWLLGGYYESRNLNYASDFVITEVGAPLLGLPLPGSDVNLSDLNQNTYAVFGQVDYKPIASLTLTAGLRYESTTSHLNKVRRFEVAGLGSFPSGLSIDDVEQDSSALLPRFAMEYRFNPTLMAYASISKGYRPAGLNYQTDSLDALKFKEETSWNYELGVKSSWFNNRLTANLAIFTNQISDYQIVIFDNSFVTSTIANAEVSITGLELELKATPVKGLDLTAGFGYIDSEFTSYTNPLTGQRLNGNRLPYAPEFTYNLAVQYRSPGGFLGRAELQGFGTYFFDEANQFKQAPFALVNARVGYVDQRLVSLSRLPPLLSTLATTAAPVGSTPLLSQWLPNY